MPCHTSPHHAQLGLPGGRFQSYLRNCGQALTTRQPVQPHHSSSDRMAGDTKACMETKIVTHWNILEPCGCRGWGHPCMLCTPTLGRGAAPSATSSGRHSCGSSTRLHTTMSQGFCRLTSTPWKPPGTGRSCPPGRGFASISETWQSSCNR